ncbi:hypothetical protein, partial [Mycobacterium kansasii]
LFGGGWGWKGPYPGPIGERADWWWYDPFQPQPPPNN